MNSEQSKKFVINAWKVFKTRDSARISELFAVDAEWIAPKGNATAQALEAPDHMVGNTAIAEFLSSGMYKLFQEVHIDFRSMIADDNTVVVEEHMSAILPSGKSYENDYCLVFVLDNMKIKQVREYMDTLKGHRIVFG